MPIKTRRPLNRKWWGLAFVLLRRYYANNPALASRQYMALTILMGRRNMPIEA